MPYMDDYYQRTIPKLPQRPPITRTAVQQRAPTTYRPVTSTQLRPFTSGRVLGATKSLVPAKAPTYNEAGMSLRYKEMMDAVKSRNARVTDMSDFYQRAVAINRPSVFGVPIRQYTQGYMDDFYQRSSAQGRISNIKPGVMDPKQYNYNALEDYYFMAKLAGGSVLPAPTYQDYGYSYPSSPYASYPAASGGGYGAGYRPDWMTGLFQLNANR